MEFDDNGTFRFDVSDYINADGELTEEGRAVLQAKLAAELSRAGLTEEQKEQVQKALRDTLRGESIFEISALSILEILDRSTKLLLDVPQGIRALAIALDHKDKPMGPHVFALGEAAGHLAIALGALDVAKRCIQHVLACDCMAPNGPLKPPRNTKPKTSN